MKTRSAKSKGRRLQNQVKEITGFTIGGVSPVGHLNKVDIFIERSSKI